MAQIIDQIVKISIEDAISSVSTVDVNAVALLGASDNGDAVAKEIVSADGAKNAFGEGSQLHEMAKDFFAQPTQPSKVVCIPLKKAGANPTAKEIIDAIKGAGSAGSFYHVCMVGDGIGTVALATLNEDLEDIKKFLHVQQETVTGSAMADLKGNKRIAMYKHKEAWGNGKEGDEKVEWKEYLNVAVVAYRCGKDSARGSFAHKKVDGITPDFYDVEEYNELISAGVNIYTEVSGEARLFMGTSCDAETFIDQVVKDDWVRFNVQSAIYRLLGDSNGGYGVNYDDAGIASVAAAVLNVLAVGEDTDHQYIMAGSSNVQYKSYDYLKKNKMEDVKKRNLPLISGSYARMNTVNTVVQVSLQVTL